MKTYLNPETSTLEVSNATTDQLWAIEFLKTSSVSLLDENTGEVAINGGYMNIKADAYQLLKEAKQIIGNNGGCTILVKNGDSLESLQGKTSGSFCSDLYGGKTDTYLLKR